MRVHRVQWGPLTALLRECWVDAANYRLSGTSPDWTDGVDRPTIHTIVIETVSVDESHRRQGHFKRFLSEVWEDKRFEMVIVEGVQNPVLADYLMRNGWNCDPGVMDFHKKKQ